MDYCLRQIAFDEETGTIDTDRIATGVSTSQRTNASIIRKCLDELENEIGKVVPLDDLVNRAIEKGLSDDKIESAIEYVKKMGEIHEPKRGFVSKLQ